MTGTPRPDPPARTARGAVDRHINRLSRSLNLVGQSHLRALELERERLYSTTANPSAMRLAAGDDFIWLEVAQRFAVDFHRGHFGEQWKCRTLAYTYTVARDPELVNERFLWHWDPANPRFPTPHVHVEGGKDHVTTGRVSIEAILRQLIVEVGVPAREGWSEVIEENEALFREFRSWS